MMGYPRLSVVCCNIKNSEVATYHQRLIHEILYIAYCKQPLPVCYVSFRLH